MPDLTLAKELQQQAAEALRIAQLVPEGTRAVLTKIAADLLAEASALEVKSTVVVAPLVTNAKPVGET